VDLQLEARIPEGYIPDTNQRLNMYQRLAAADEDGLCMQPRRWKTAMAACRIPCSGCGDYGIAAVGPNPAHHQDSAPGEPVYIGFHPSTPVRPEYLVKLSGPAPAL